MPRHFCVAGVALGDIHLDFTWQVWHNCTSTVALRGRRGTHSHPRSCQVAGVAQPHIYRRFAWQARHNLTSTVVLRGRGGTYGTGWRAWTWFRRPWRPWRRATLRGRRGTWWHPPWLHARSFCVAGASLMALGDVHLDFTWHAVWHNLTSMTPAVDHDYIPGMITSHRACRKSSQNLRLRPKECRTLLWSAEVWRAHHRFDRGLCHKRSFGKQRREKNHQSLVELEEGEWDTSWDLVFSTHPWIPQRISVVSISCFFSGLQWQVTI